MKISIFGYVIFVLLCIFISGYRHFPTDTASKYVQHEISRFNSNLNLSIDGIKPVFPPGIKADTILVNYAGNLVGELEKFKLGFDLFSIFRDANKYHFKTGAKDGVISGTITLPEKEQGLAILESEFKTLLLDHLSLGEKLYGLQLSGTANGKITAAMDKLKLTTGHGQINIDNAVFELGPLNFWVEQISFLSVDLMITMPDPDTMKIEKCSMKGKQLDLESAGEIKIARLFENSQLNLKVSIHLYPMFFMEAAGSIPANVAKANSDGTKVELTIGGTIQNPKIKILQGKK